MKEHPTLKGIFVTKDGRVFSNRHKHGKCKLRERSVFINKGYLDLIIDGKHKKVHRLVAETYIPNPNNLPCINHIDENPTNNNIDNLEWCDHSYNMEYSNAKVWKIKTPEGNIIEVFNLNKWCKEKNLSSNTFYKRGKHKGYVII